MMRLVIYVDVAPDSGLTDDRFPTMLNQDVHDDTVRKLNDIGYENVDIRYSDGRL